jgi:hypothetical protein
MAHEPEAVDGLEVVTGGGFTFARGRVRDYEVARERTECRKCRDDGRGYVEEDQPRCL